MARVLFSSVVTSVQGKVGGSVFQRNRSGYTFKNKANSVNKASSKQSLTRSYIVAVQNAWRGLTDSQRNAWDVFANFKPVKNRNNSNVFLTGYQLFLKYNLIRLQGGYTIRTSITYSAITNLSVTCDLIRYSSTEFYADLDHDLDANYGVLIKMSAPRLSDYPVKANSYKVIIPNNLTDNHAQIAGNYSAIYGYVPAVGLYIAYKITIFDIAQPVIREGYFDVGQVVSP